MKAAKAPYKQKAETSVDKGKKSSATQCQDPFVSTPKQIRSRKGKAKQRAIDSSNRAHDSEMEDLPAVKPEPLAWDARMGVTEASHNVGDTTQTGNMNNAGVPGPVLNIIQPMPQNSPQKPPACSNTNTFLNVLPPDTWASSETLSVASSISKMTMEKIHHYAS